MNYGFENNNFYIDYYSSNRPVGNMREENDRRAIELSSQYNNLLLSLSSGVDSQSILHSFKTQGLDIETVFMYLPGYNDNEYNNLKIIDKKYSIKTNIIDIDPIACKEDLESEAIETGIHVYSLLWKKFLTLIPDSANYVQMTHDPYVHFKDGKPYYYMGYQSPEILRDRAFNLVNRTGSYIFYGNTPEFLYSILSDKFFRAGVCAVNYYHGNGLTKQDVKLDKFDRWDYYIKPMIYGCYWKDELIYFPKYVGFEKLEYLKVNAPVWQNAVAVPYYDFLKFLNLGTGEVRRFYDNVTKYSLSKNL